MIEEHRSRSPADTEAIGRLVATRVAAGGVVLMTGPLGAGKTLLAKAIFGALGVDPERVTSPTFQLVNRYRSVARPGLTLGHVDLYRIEGAADLESLGLDELLETAGAVVVVEWAERLAGWPGLQPIRVTIADLGDDDRLVHIEAAK